MRIIAMATLFAISTNASAAARLFLINVAPDPSAAISVPFSVEGSEVAQLSYREASGYVEVPAGSIRVSTIVDGRSLERAISLVDGLDYTVALGPATQTNGGLTLHLMLDHNHSMTRSSTTFQRANLAAIRGSVSFGINCRGLATNKTLNNEKRENAIQREFGDGTVTDVTGSSNLSRIRLIDAPTLACQVAVGNGSSTSQADIVVNEGAVNRVFAIGDGENQPLEALVVTQEVRPPLAVIAAEPALEGLWFTPGKPGEGIAVIWNDSKQALENTYFGFGNDGQSRWYAVSSEPARTTLNELEFIARDFRQTESFDGGIGLGSEVVDRLRIVFHGCNSATAVVQQSKPFGVSFNVERFPQNALKLTQIASSGAECLEKEVQL